MKRLSLTILICMLVLFSALAAKAFVRYEDKHPQKRRDIHITGFIDYAPFGFVEHPDAKIYGKFSSIFEPMIETMAKENNWRLFYDLQKDKYNTLVQGTRQGEYDILLGAYHETEEYRGLELIYPAALNNPITVFMLPNRINGVKSVNDLKKLKGVRISREVYSDYINEQIKQFNLETVDTSYDMFERLFTQKVDYILVSHYFGLIEAIKLGLREQVAVAKQTIWQIPMFIAVSKLSRERKLLSQKLTRYIEDPNNQKAFQQNIAQMVAEFEKKYQGTVPPTFGLEKETTPSDNSKAY